MLAGEKLFQVAIRMSDDFESPDKINEVEFIRRKRPFNLIVMMNTYN